MSEPSEDATLERSDADTVILPRGPLATGSRVNGRYVLEDSIGVGGFGRVFRARDEMLGRSVAFKILTRTSVASNLIEEAKTVAKLDHPHIVPVYDVGVADDTPWMAMKLIDGVGVDQVLRREGRLTRDRAVHIAAQAATALSHAHRRGIVHRDIKPSNILLSRGDDGGEHAWLADFGIAKILISGTTSSDEIIAGTPSYMAPEQITGRRVDARSDIFSLACVTVEMITGRRCFGGGSYSDLVYKIVHDVPDLADVGAIAGEEVEQAIRRALSKSPDDRQQTIEEFSRELRQRETKPRPRLKRMLTREEPAWDGRHVIAARELRKGYDFRRTPVLHDVSIHVERGAIYALLGRNGSGKTTLLRTLLGIYRRDRGDVRIFGRDPERHNSAVMERVGYVTDTLPIYDTLRVSEYLDLLRASFPNWDDALAYELLGRYRLPSGARIKTLSRGMRTELGLLGALAHRPELLVLDDPTLGLDAVVLDDFFDTLADVARRDGTTVLIASHNIAEVETVATHVGLFADGRIVVADRLDALRTRTREVRMTFANDIPATIRSIPEFTTIRTSGRRVTGVVLDETTGAIERLKALAPEDIEVRELSLKEIFVNFMRQR
jgi:ABC-2 type transport system ATP-binding protein